MSRVPNRGEQPAVHPVLEKAPAIKDGDVHDISQFLYAHPQIADAIEWLHENIDPFFVPEELGMFWRGFIDYDGTPRVPLVLTTKGSLPFWQVRLKHDRQEYDRVEAKYYAFLTTLTETFPETKELLNVFL